VSYAARHPERVSHLLLFGSYLRGGEICAPGVQGMLQQLVRESWGIGSRAITDLFAPNLSAEERRALSRAHRLAASPEMSARLLALTFEMEVLLEAPTVETPALVLHRKGDRSIPFRAGRALAAALPCATFLPLEGDAHIPWYGDCAATSDAILAFLGQAAVAAAAAPSSARRELCREGSLWRVSFGGSQTHVPHARGLADLAVLLANPDQEVHVGTLWSGASTLAELGGGHDAALDDRALAAYRQRLRALEAGLQEAETKQQSERVEALRAERDMLARELRAAVGLGGRKRGLNDVSERARKAVGARIRASLKKIALVHPQLGEHLNARISTGSFCRYEADSEQPWTVESSSLARIEQRR